MRWQKHFLVSVFCGPGGLHKGSGSIRGLCKSRTAYLPIGAAKAAVDQRMGELLLPARELEPVRLEFVAAGAGSCNALPLCDEHVDRFL